MSNNESSCFVDTLKVIDVIQRNAQKIECIDEGCTKPFLGGGTTLSCFNTRPVTFYNCQNNLFTINYTQTVDGVVVNQSTTVFRVERVENNTVTVLLLAPNTTSTDPNRAYTSTGQYATINLNCVCALRCLPDIIIDCLL